MFCVIVSDVSRYDWSFHVAWNAIGRSHSPPSFLFSPRSFSHCPTYKSSLRLPSYRIFSSHPLIVSEIWSVHYLSNSSCPSDLFLFSLPSYFPLPSPLARLVFTAFLLVPQIKETNEIVRVLEISMISVRFLFVLTSCLVFKICVSESDSVRSLSVWFFFFF